MRIVLFDAITERHVGDSLARALRMRGHEVLATGPVWRGHVFPSVEDHREVIAPAVRRALEWEPDAVICLRAAALRPRIVASIASTGARTLVWFPDDPVLYRILYRHVVDAYDLVLHCGSARVLRHYDERHGPTGVNFPFWTDSVAYPPVHDPAAAEHDLVFLGNVFGQVRTARYDALAALPFDVRIHGTVESDPAGLWDGRLAPDEVAANLGRFRAGVNIPQRFADYRGTPQDFRELARLGTFEIPSRVVQYAAAGLPVLSIEPRAEHDAFPEMVVGRTPAELAERARPLLADEDRLRSLGKRTRQRFETWYDADRRAALLERLIADPSAALALPTEVRAVLWRHPEADPGAVETVRAARPRAQPRRSVLVSGYYGAGNAGDELILRALAAGLEPAGGGTQVVVAAHRPGHVLRDHGLPAFKRTQASLGEAVVRAVSAVVLGGGGLLHDYHFARAGGVAGLFEGATVSVQGWSVLPLLARVLGRPAHLYAVGAGPLEDPGAQALVRWLGESLESASVRDAASREVLERIPGWPRPVEVVPDPVYALDLEDAPPPHPLLAERRVLVVNVRPWEPAQDALLTGRLGRALGAVARRHDLALVGVPFQDARVADAHALEALFDLVPSDVPRVVLPWTADPAVLAATLRPAAAVVAMRLHANLLAHRVGVPAVGLGYDPKVHAHFAEVGRSPACLGLGAGEDELAAALEAAVTGGEGADPARVAALEAGARAGLEALAERIAAAEPVAEPLPEAVLSAPVSALESVC